MDVDGRGVYTGVGWLIFEAIAIVLRWKTFPIG